MGFLRLIRRYAYPFRDKTRIRLYALQHMQRRGFSKEGVPNGNDVVHPVLIIGAGPVGLVLSILLTKLGRLYMVKAFLLIDTTACFGFYCRKSDIKVRVRKLFLFMYFFRLNPLLIPVVL